jgi:tRNA A-37 threonylcarbamoyl transferase component Bud32
VNPELYARAKELFIDLVNKSTASREAYLTELERSDKELAQEVRSLLDKHFSRTIMMPTSKDSKTTTQHRLSTLGIQRLSQRLVGGILPLAVALSAALFLIAVAWYLQSALERQTKADYDAVLTSMAEQKSNLLLQWIRGNELRIQDWGRQTELQELVLALDNKIQNPSLSEGGRRETLANCDEQAKVKCVLEKLTNQPVRLQSETKDATQQANERLKIKYAIWNRSSILLADWQYANEKTGLGGLATPVGASILSRVFDRKATTVELPRPTADSITKDYPLETDGQYVMFFVPVFAPDDANHVIGAMMIRSSVFLTELQTLINTPVHSPANCYLLDDRGAIATEAKDVPELLALPYFVDNRKVHGSLVLESRDPGGNLLAGFKPTGNVNEWSWTKPGKTVTQPSNGSDVQGYRDYRGREVVGAWFWIESMRRLLVLEIPKEQAFKTQKLIDRTFRVIYGIPIIIALTIGLLSLRRAFSTMELTNKSLGAYKLEEKIGEGGLGIVYRGEHKLLGRQAAIKLIKEPLANSSTQRRFEREVRMAAKLDHPNTVSIYDFGISKQGLMYCAMELVDGVNLAHFLAFEPELPLDRCLWILRQISGAMEEAHSVGLIHRDIKPQNIMICKKGQLADLVKVVDFGLAKTMVESIGREFTATRVLVGTPGFIAPERLETPWIADPRIDIFAFGVLGAFLLTNRVPILGVTADSMLQTLAPGRLGPHVHDPHFVSLVQLLATCIAPDPLDRPSSMHDVCESLETIASHFPWNEDAAEKWWRIHGDELIAFARKKDSKAAK